MPQQEASGTPVRRTAARRADRRDIPFGPYGPSVVVTQGMVGRYADLTDDRQPIHVNPQWAENNSPYARTVGHGFLTLGLLYQMVHHEVAKHLPDGQVVNWRGTWDFPRPVLTGTAIHARMRVLRDVSSRGLGRFIDLEVEVRGLEDDEIRAKVTMLVVCK